MPTTAATTAAVGPEHIHGRPIIPRRAQQGRLGTSKEGLNQAYWRRRGEPVPHSWSVAPLRMIVATAQSLITADVRQNGEHIRSLMRRAASSQARLLHLPEGALSGYVKSQVLAWPDVDWSVVEDELAAIASEAAGLGLWVVVGSNHPLPAPSWPQNSLHVISDEGRVVARYSKRFCSNTEVTAWYTPGADPVTFDVEGYRFGCALCIEVCFPEVFAEYERLDVDCVLLSSYSRDPAYDLLGRAHAATCCYWLSLSVPAQCSDALPSRFVDPNGDVVAAAAADGAAIIVSRLDRSSPEYEIAIERARPWRRSARDGGIYGHRVR